MASNIGKVEVKRERGKLVVQGSGETPRGKAFIRSTVVLAAERTTDPAFKEEISAAVKEMLVQSSLPL